MKTEVLMLGKRVKILEADTRIVHGAVSELNTRLNVIEQLMEKGFSSLENRFNRLESWLKERL
jgi:hypothetical protein